MLFIHLQILLVEAVYVVYRQNNVQLRSGLLGDLVLIAIDMVPIEGELHRRE